MSDPKTNALIGRVINQEAMLINVLVYVTQMLGDVTTRVDQLSAQINPEFKVDLAEREAMMRQLQAIRDELTTLSKIKI